MHSFNTGLSQMDEQIRVNFDSTKDKLEGNSKGTPQDQATNSDINMPLISQVVREKVDKLQTTQVNNLSIILQLQNH